MIFLQILFFAGWYNYEKGAFSELIAQIRVKTKAYDPRDLLSGQYIRLSYSFSSLSRWDTKKDETIIPQWAKRIYTNDYVESNKNKEVWVVLHKSKDLYEPKAATFTQPSTLAKDDIVIKGRLQYNRILYGIEKYFLPEGTIEPKLDDVTVELNIYKNGRIRISKVFLNGKVWP